VRIRLNGIVHAWKKSTGVPRSTVRFLGWHLRLTISALIRERTSSGGDTPPREGKKELAAYEKKGRAMGMIVAQHGHTGEKIDKALTLACLLRKKGGRVAGPHKCQTGTETV